MNKKPFIVFLVVLLGSSSIKLSAQEAIIKPKSKTSVLLLGGISANSEQFSLTSQLGFVRERNGSYIKVGSDISSEYYRFSITGGIIHKFNIPLFLNMGIGYGALDNTDYDYSGFFSYESGYEFDGMQIEAGLILKIKKVLISLGPSFIVVTDTDDYDFMECFGNSLEINIGIGVIL